MTMGILRGADPAAIALAARALADGKLVAFPTETVYGLGADADNDSACRSVYTAKGRPADHPLIVHVSGSAGVEHYARDVPEFAHRLISAFWPGPLTVIVGRRPDVGSAAAGHQDSIGLRCPSHPVAQALIRAFEALGGHGIAAPSANRFGRVSPTTAQHVVDGFSTLSPCPLSLVLDGGPCEVGIESTIIDCTRGAPVLLRPGILTPTEIEAAAGVALTANGLTGAVAPHASGTLASHYAPKATVQLMSAAELDAALRQAPHASSGGRDMASLIGVYARQPAPDTPGDRGVVFRRMPDDALAAAHELFAVLHEFDTCGVKQIWVENPPDTPAWIGVRDRLRRAAA